MPGRRDPVGCEVDVVEDGDGANGGLPQLPPPGWTPGQLLGKGKVGGNQV